MPYDRVMLTKTMQVDPKGIQLYSDEYLAECRIEPILNAV